MHRFLLDEDMPRSTATALRGAGHAAEDVRDVGLRGHSDADVYAYAQATAATLISCDKGFANVTAFPIGSHAGIVVVRIPDEVSPAELNRELLHAISQFGNDPFIGCLVIVEVGRIRIRRPQT
jgi:predicted nuclease of predicted toxin-antitoxin system